MAYLPPQKVELGRNSWHVPYQRIHEPQPQYPVINGRSTGIIRYCYPLLSE
jgi:hypothetical protein